MANCGQYRLSTARGYLCTGCSALQNLSAIRRQKTVGLQRHTHCSLEMFQQQFGRPTSGHDGSLRVMRVFADRQTRAVYTDELAVNPTCFITRQEHHKRRRLLRLVVPQICVTDRKSTRLNSSHRCISYAVFCLKKKKKKKNNTIIRKLKETEHLDQRTSIMH